MKKVLLSALLLIPSTSFAKGGGVGNLMKSQYEAGFQAGIERGSTTAIILAILTLTVGLCIGYLIGRKRIK